MEAHSRKRSAPGASPVSQHRIQNSPQPAPRFPTVSDPSQLSDDQFLSWGQGNKLSQSDSLNNQSYIIQNGREGLSVPGHPGSNQLIRRYPNEQGAYQVQQPLQNSQVQRHDANRGTPTVMEDSDEDEGDLDVRAAVAKRDALSRRPPKQIPPFIQKLSSFLDDPKNHELIRWADDGRSFVVIDEERFANELIPEMFKHKNYASFVRQLNMYGFHKKVGLSDNSMRASEKKAKLPSGYKHKYFRQGRPELLWLIEKPKPGKVNKSKGDSADNMDDGGVEGEVDPGGTRSKSHEQTDLITLPKADLANVQGLQEEVHSLQRSQQQIYSILARMRDDNNQYIKQASQLVANHERHDQSINAILQFLATFYTQNLQGRGNPANMFPNAMPSQDQRGNVVEEMADFADSPVDYTQLGRNTPPIRRPLALLPAPSEPSEEPIIPAKISSREHHKSAQQSRITPVRDATRPSSAGSSAHSSPRPKQQQSPPSQQRQAESQDILNVINRSNAQQNSSATPRFDFSSALRQYSQDANGKNGPLTPEQRDTMLNIMANHSGTSTPGGRSTNNATGSLDPSPYLDYFNNNQDQLDLLQRLQEQQDSRVLDLAGRLQPLSPSGSIPGLEVLNNGTTQQAPDGSTYPGSFAPNTDGFDFDNYLNDEFLDGADGAADLNTDDYNLDWSNLNEGDNDELFAGGTETAGQDGGVNGAAAASSDVRRDGTGPESVPASDGSQTPRAVSVQDVGEDEQQQPFSKRRRVSRSR